jgi:alpha-acetolactate decarboxylase
MNNQYTLQTGKIMKTVNGKVVLNKQYAFDYDGKKANIVLKDNNDLHEYKLTNKKINDMFTKIMNNDDLSLKEKLKQMLDNENKKSKKKKQKNTKKVKKNSKKKTRKARKNKK